MSGFFGQDENDGLKPNEDLQFASRLLDERFAAENEKALAYLASRVSGRIATHGIAGYCRKHLVLLSEFGFCWKCRQENERTGTGRLV